jgi:glycosyltransferase involved in cell wall biosynthesis
MASNLDVTTEVVTPTSTNTAQLTVTNTDHAGERATERNTEIFRLRRDPDTYEAIVESSISLRDYRRKTRLSDWALLLRLARPLRGKTVVFINPTMAGGGVAMLRPPLVHMLTMLGVSAHWYVMEPLKNTSENPFVFTKLMHNIIQRRTTERITPNGKALHRRWNMENTDVLRRQKHIKDADIIVIDDPQPAPLFAFFKELNPTAKIVWRNHIDNSGELMADPSTPQGEVWQYLRDECRIGEADAFVFHPVEAFVPKDVHAKTFFVPATVEPHDDLNRRLTFEEIHKGIQFINDEIANKNEELAAQGRAADKQKLLTADKRRLVLIARFDESKGMDKAMELGVRVRRKMAAAGVPDKDLPEVLLVGNGSVDDPSGLPMYEEMLRLRREKYPDDMQDIIVMRLKHNYGAMNALMHTSTIGLQTSEAEGLENRITDWIEHGVPVVISNRGGMPLQVIEGKSGHILDFSREDFDLERGAELITDLLMDSDKYTAVKQSTMIAAHEFNSREFTTTANVTRWLRVFDSVLAGKPADKVWKVSDLVDRGRPAFVRAISHGTRHAFHHVAAKKRIARLRRTTGRRQHRV